MNVLAFLNPFKSAKAQHDWAIYKRLLGYMWPYRKRFALGILCTLPVSAMGGLMAYATGVLADQLLKTQRFDLFYWLPLAVIAVQAVEAVFRYYSQYLTSYVGTCVSEDLRRILFQRLIHADLGYLRSESKGQMMSRYYSDPSRLQVAVVSNLQTLILDGFTMLGLTTVLLLRSPLLAGLALAVISFIVIPIRQISRKIRKLDNENQEYAAALFDVFYETIIGIDILRLYHLTDRQYKQFRTSLKQSISNGLRLVKATSILKPVMQIIASAGVAVILALGGYLVQHGQMSTGDLLSFVVAMIMLYQPIKNIGNTMSSIQRVLAPAERVFEKLDLEPTIVDAPNAEKAGEFESLTFQNVSFDYHSDKPSSQAVLKGINLTITKGEVVAIVGRTGGGKSTLVNLIPRFYDPTEGQMLWNGQPYSHFTQASLHKHVAMVTQNTVLFNGTLESNIQLGRPGATAEELNAVYEMAQVSTIIDTKLGGSKSPTGPGGVHLSGGQRQRVALARALMKDAPILILDEATSALDNETEYAIQQALRKLIDNQRTLIIIAHRLSTIRHATRILVVDHGEVIEDGSHTELMARNGMYARLYNLQFAEDDLPTPPDTVASFA